MKMHFRTKILKRQNKGERINNKQTEEIENIKMGKFMKLKIINTSIKMQLDTSSDIAD